MIIGLHFYVLSQIGFIYIMLVLLTAANDAKEAAAMMWMKHGQPLAVDEGSDDILCHSAQGHASRLILDST